MTFDYSKYATTQGAWVKFENVGDQVIGVIKEVRDGRTFDGNPCPELVIEDEDGDERIITASQVKLGRIIVEKAPQAGNKIRITYSGVGDAMPGKAPPKLFEVDVKEGQFEVKNPVVTMSSDTEPF